jgi:spermidine synthase
MDFYLYLTVFASGMTTLGIEFAASRLLGSVFGTSNLVWASIIGLILIYLTAGYFIGGRWADKSPSKTTFYQIIIWGAFSAGLVPFLSRPVLLGAASAFDQLEVGVLLGSFTAVLILLIIPITLLGTVSPFAIRLALKDPESAGKISGRIYAISTLGSFLGTFLPDLVLIPWVGTRLTFAIFSGFLVVIALIGFGRSGNRQLLLKYLWMPVVLIGISVLWGKAPIKDHPDQIYEKESSYNYIQVLERDDYRYLRLNEGQGIHSIYHPERNAFYGTWMQVLPAPFLNPYPYLPEDVESAAIIGLAAGTTAWQLTDAFGPIPIDGFEIDPEIIQVGKDYFEMNQENLNIIPEDGRWGLRKSEKSYSLISIDAYRPPYIPWHLTTREFFQEVKDQLSPEGVMALNVGRTPTDEKLLSSLAATIMEVFPSVYIIDVPGSYNSMIYATKQPTDFSNLGENFRLLLETEGHDPTLIEAMNIALVQQREIPDGGIVFTDNYAPLERITNRMVLSYVLNEENPTGVEVP